MDWMAFETQNDAMETQGQITVETPGPSGRNGFETADSMGFICCSKEVILDHSFWAVEVMFFWGGVEVGKFGLKLGVGWILGWIWGLDLAYLVGLVGTKDLLNDQLDGLVTKTNPNSPQSVAWDAGVGRCWSFTDLLCPRLGMNPPDMIQDIEQKTNPGMHQRWRISHQSWRNFTPDGWKMDGLKTHVPTKNLKTLCEFFAPRLLHRDALSLCLIRRKNKSQWISGSRRWFTLTTRCFILCFQAGDISYR